jgi:energy-coupling factor transporter ATP-binding protein EcfA2
MGYYFYFLTAGCSMDKVPVIEFQNFSFQYYSQAEPTLHEINLTIYAGEKILIVGPSGSGKSTLGHCLNGLIPFYYKGVSQGSLKINGIETKDLDIFKLSKMIGTVLQDSDGQFVGLSVSEDPQPGDAPTRSAGRGDGGHGRVSRLFTL